MHWLTVRQTFPLEFPHHSVDVEMFVMAAPLLPVALIVVVVAVPVLALLLVTTKLANIFSFSLVLVVAFPELLESSPLFARYV